MIQALRTAVAAPHVMITAIARKLRMKKKFTSAKEASLTLYRGSGNVAMICTF